MPSTVTETARQEKQALCQSESHSTILPKGNPTRVKPTCHVRWTGPDPRVAWLHPQCFSQYMSYLAADGGLRPPSPKHALSIQRVVFFIDKKALSNSKILLFYTFYTEEIQV